MKSCYARKPTSGRAFQGFYAGDGTDAPCQSLRVMGHRNTNMIINVYMKLIEDARETKDGSLLGNAYNMKTGGPET
jgi:hypothetical protein